MIYVFISKEGKSFPLAKKLAEEGERILPCRAEKFDAYEDLECPSFPTVLAHLINAVDKEEYFVIVDDPSLGMISEQLVEAGFTQGMFPTEEDFEEPANAPFARIRVTCYNSKELFATVCVLNTRLGVGDVGPCVESSISLLQELPLSSPIILQAFKDVEYEEATGLVTKTVDVSLEKGALVFSNARDTANLSDFTYTEIEMSGGPKKFFESIIEERNPIAEKYGCGVHLFNLFEEEIGVPKEESLWLWGVDKEGLMSKGRDTGMATSSGDSAEDAEELAYSNCELFSKKFYYRVSGEELRDRLLKFGRRSKGKKEEAEYYEKED